MARDGGGADGAWGTWSYGDVAVRREHLKGHLWTLIPTYVVEDRPELMVTFIATGSTLGFPDFPFPRWEHPWKAAGHTRWTGHGKPMMQRPGDGYSVDVFWRGDDRRFSGWYLNLQEPLVRDAASGRTWWDPAWAAWPPPAEWGPLGLS